VANLPKAAAADRSLAERLQGWTHFSWRLSIVSSVLGVVAVTLTAAGPQPSDAVLGRAFLGALGALLVTNAIVAIAQWLARVRPHPQHGFALVAIFAGIGALFGAVGYLSTVVLSLPTTVPAIVWIISGAVIVAWWMTTAELGRYARVRAGIERSALAARAESVRDAEALRVRLSSDLLAEAHDELLPVRDMVRGEATDAQATAARIESQVAGSVRSLSHRLWQVNPEVDLRPSTVTVLKTIVTKRPFRPALLSLLYVLVDAPGWFQRAAPLDALSVLSVSVLGIFFVMGVANYLMRRYPHWHVWVFIGAIAVFQVATLALAPWHESLDGRPLTVGEYLLSVPLSIALIVLTTGFGSWWESSKSLIHDYAQALDENEAALFAQTQAAAAATREVAALLHGSVQSRLLAAAQSMRVAARRGDVAAVESALAAAAQALEGLADLEHSSRTDVNARQQISDICEPWREVIDIELEMEDSLLDAQGDVASSLCAVVEELITNAFRHGSATSIMLRAGWESRGITVTSLDNGTFDSSSSTGLGTRIIDSLGAQRHVDLSDAGTRVQVLLPVR